MYNLISGFLQVFLSTLHSGIKSKHKIFKCNYWIFMFKRRVPGHCILRRKVTPKKKLLAPPTHLRILAICPQLSEYQCDWEF